MPHLWRPPRHADLAPFVDSFEYVEDVPGTAQERMIPGGGVSIVVMLRGDGFACTDLTGSRWVDGACLTGPQQRAQVISTSPQRGMIAVNFAPGGAAPFLRLPLHAVTDDYPSLSEVWGRPGAVVRERLEGASPQRMLDLAEQVLLEQASGRSCPTPPSSWPSGPWTGRVGRHRGRAVRDDGQAVHPPLPRGDGADTQDVRAPPPAAARTRLATVRSGGCGGHPPSRLGPVDWARLATEQGYSDQSHLVHDFSAITGITPSAYRPRSADVRNHLPV